MDQPHHTLDRELGLFPGTTWIRELAGGVSYRQHSHESWQAWTSSVVARVEPRHPPEELSGWGSTPEEACVDLWAKLRAVTDPARLRVTANYDNVGDRRTYWRWDGNGWDRTKS